MSYSTSLFSNWDTNPKQKDVGDLHAELIRSRIWAARHWFSVLMRRQTYFSCSAPTLNDATYCAATLPGICSRSSNCVHEVFSTWIDEELKLYLHPSQAF